MSMKFTALALDYGPQDAFEKLLLLALCDRADEQGICWPSRQDLITRTGASYSTVTRKLRALEAAEWIQRKRRFNQSCVFRVNVERLLQLEAQARAEKSGTVPHGFKMFAEEASQAIENKGKAHSDRGKAHCDRGKAHSDRGKAHCATDEPSKNQSLNKGPAALFVDLNVFSKYQLSSLRGGNDVYLGSQGWLKAGTQEHERAAELLRKTERAVA